MHEGAATQALLVSPVGPVVGLVVAAASEDVDSAFSISFRYHRGLMPHVALSVIPVLGAASVLSVGIWSAGVKVGARLSLATSGLAGWYATPLVLLGGVWASQGERSLSSSGLLGLGLEAGRAWRWDRFMLEAGIGVQYSGYLAHEAFDNSPVAGPGLKPLANVSLGYAWD